MSDRRMVKLADNLWINPEHVMIVAAAAEGGGSIVGLVGGANVATPDPPIVVVALLAGEPAGGARPRLKLVRDPEG